MTRKKDFEEVDSEIIMKRTFWLCLLFLAILLTIFLTGCKCPPTYPKSMVEEVNKNAVRNKAFLNHSEKLTKDQLERMIKANEEAWKSLLNTLLEGEKIDDKIEKKEEEE